jgi:hypothetical protein
MRGAALVCYCIFSERGPLAAVVVPSLHLVLHTVGLSYGGPLPGHLR